MANNKAPAWWALVCLGLRDKEETRKIRVVHSSGRREYGPFGSGKTDY